ncbi:integrase arm-type DNA-binding domain-containing protein [Stenotrophomonas sp.]|jgi:integrase|uniref:tyrosine-type recombinase/integrase n=1 Tax=Stenotrophomonas sp. TaxID=69392 RepID=UPI0019AC4E5F|nr:integrase arm-type DNA-binding domain-containing protein [Stenotrophomonas sp.]MBD3825578.1 integrase arm-type DNA-binding domain-containing protein [Stenotrophomonas sp.]
MPLTDAAIRRAKPADKPQKLADGGGLFLLITIAGAKSWRWKYRIAGKEKLLTLGLYPDVSLAQAREAKEDARRLLASGVDPSEQRKAAVATRAADTVASFEVIAREWLAGRPWVPAYGKKVIAWFEKDVFPYIGARRAGDLKASDFLQVARRMEARAAFESAHRVMQNCGQVMRYAVATDRAERNPVADLRGALVPAPEKNHAAIVDPVQLGGLLRALHAYHGTPVVQAALKLAPMLFVRPGELRQAEWTEVDLDAGLWSIPAARMKMRQAHIVPLARQAVAVLKELQPVTGHGQYVFAGGRSEKRPMSEVAVLAALRVMGFDKDTVTGHGFRATARTLLDEVLGFRPDIIEHQLAHAVKDPNGRAYNRTTHMAERVRMMQEWADYLERLRAGTVVQLRPDQAA